MLWAIRNKRGLWWSERWGWGSQKGCNLYSNQSGYNLPIGGRWVRYR